MYVLQASSHALPLLPLPVQPGLAGAFLLAPSAPIVLIILLAAIFIVGIVLRGGQFLNRRHAAMQAMASRVGLRPWSGDSLPRGLSLEGTLFHEPCKIANVFEGALNHNEVVILDFFKQETDSAWSRTILAIKSRSAVRTPPHLESRRIGGWQVLYAPIRMGGSSLLMDVDRLELLIRNLNPPQFAS